MVSAKIASIIAVAAFATGTFFTSPVQEALAAVIATDVQCTGCVGSSDLAGNAVTAAKIKDGEVKAAEIATDAVGAAELAGVTKLLFGECAITSNAQIIGGGVTSPSCAISGVDPDDRAIAILNHSDSGFICLNISAANPDVGEVFVIIKNGCTNPVTPGTVKIGIMVYDK
jgi:hypothetical protein